MESNKNSDNNGKEEQQQLRGSARKRTFNELTNDEDKPTEAAREEDQPEPEDCSSSKKNREEENDLLNLELESFSREELIKLVRKQMGMTMEAQKQLEAAKKETEESQHKVKELISEMAKVNAEYQKLVEQIVQFPHETEEEIAENEKQAAVLPTHQPMKIQLAKETWFDILAFLQRRKLGQIVPQIGDPQFTSIVQSFLHNYGRITLSNIYITGPHHRLIQHDVPMPENVKDFTFLDLSMSHFNTSIINLLQKFRHNSLFANVNLDLSFQDRSIREELAHVLPLIDNNKSIQGWSIEQLDTFYNANSGMAMAMLKMARILEIQSMCDGFPFRPNESAFLNRWLHTPRDDGNARVLILHNPPFNSHRRFSLIPRFVNGTIKLEFANAKSPCSFFIRLYIGDPVLWQDSSMENEETQEKLVIKKVGLSRSRYLQIALISRYPSNAGKKWIEANEREVLDWQFDEQNGRISFS